MSKEIGRKIKVRRVELDMTQQDVADKVNVTKNTISRYEGGKVKDVDYRLIKAIYELLGIDTKILAKHLPHTPAASRDDLEEKVLNLEKEVSELKTQLIRLLAK